MIFNTFELHQEGSLPGAHLVTYIQEYSEAMAINDRPLILLCPGGGYTRTSDREAEPMALKFLAMGYHAAVLRYSCAPAEYPTSGRTAVMLSGHHFRRVCPQRIF